MGLSSLRSVLRMVQYIIVTWVGLYPLQVWSQAVIDNDLATGTIGFLEATVKEAGQSAQVRITAEQKSNPGVPHTNYLVYAYQTYFDIASSGVELGDISTDATLSGDDQASSSGTITGSGGNTIDWTVTTSIPDESMTMISVFTFTAQTGTLGTLLFYQYLDEDIDASNSDDVFYYSGTAANGDLQLYTADNVEVYGLSHGGAYSAAQGLVNATFLGWAAGMFDTIQGAIVSGTLDEDIAANSGACINTTDLPEITHADLGTVYGPSDVGSALLWQVDSDATTATIVTTMGGVPSASYPPEATNMTQIQAYLQGASSVALDDIVITDADAGETLFARLTLSNTATGSLTATSGQGETYNPTTGVWSITGLEAAVNTALAAVAFVPVSTNALDTTIITHVEDAGGMGPTDGVITLDVTPCEPNCDACSDADTCTDCSSGYYLHVGNCLGTCPTGYFANGTTGACEECEDYCDVCDNGTTCTDCSSGYYLYGEDCVDTCPTGYFANGTIGACEECEDYCDVCDNGTTCTDCSSGYYLHVGNCLGTCPTGYFANGTTGACEECEDYCDVCDNGTTCTDCSEGYYLHVGNCLGTCPTGYFANGTTGACEECEEYCDVCDNGTTCTDCSQGYHLHEADCLSECPAGTYTSLDGESCDICDISCAECDGPTENDCTACDQEDLLHEGHCYPQVCGDEILAPNEGCDDGNVDVGDGCDGACEVEHGYQCAGEPSVCESTCGDGILASDEACDDGGTEDGDGCSAVCVIESEHSCEGEPSVCEPDCGDGVLGETEECDDENNTDEDGCSSVCTIEAGYACEGEPSVCMDGCGNGVVGEIEECDDENLTDGDGCSSVCTIEEGNACADEPSVCEEGCGDGFLGDVEECDDGNLEDEDGCTEVCTLEHGYVCDGEPSVCAPVCGDGLIADIEDCDDGNTLSNDGCSSDCETEQGYSCDDEEPSTCSANCGDGLIGHTEECDDGNTEAGDGCSSVCEVEKNFVCQDEPSDCKPDFDSWDLEGGGCSCSLNGDSSVPGQFILLLLVLAGLVCITRRLRKYQR